MKRNKKSGLVVKSTVKAGGFSINHNRAVLRKSGLAVKSSVKAGGFSINHNRVLMG
jgi:hypothetical protein